MNAPIQPAPLRAACPVMGSLCNCEYQPCGDGGEDVHVSQAVPCEGAACEDAEEARALVTLIDGRTVRVTPCPICDTAEPVEVRIAADSLREWWNAIAEDSASTKYGLPRAR